MSKKLILSQEQLDEICGGNSAYLDNEISDFKNIGNNEITADGYIDGDFGDPMLNRDWAMQDRGRQLSRMHGYGLGRASYHAYESKKSEKPVIYEESKKSTWAKKHLNEEFKDPMLVNATFTTGNENASGDKKKRNVGSLKTAKLRYRAAQAQANSTDPEKRKRGLSTLKTMDKNDPNLKQEIDQYDKLRASAKNIRKLDSEVFGKKQIDRSGPSKGNGKAHTPKDDEFSDGFITYDA
jgi:hypothetical protein